MSVEDSPSEHQRLPVFVNLSEKHGVLESKKENIVNLWTPIKEDNTVQHWGMSQNEIAELESTPWNAETVLQMSETNQPTSSHVMDAQKEKPTVNVSEIVRKEKIVPESKGVTVHNSNQQYERYGIHDFVPGNRDQQSQQPVARFKPKKESTCTPSMPYKNNKVSRPIQANPYNSSNCNTRLMMFVLPYVPMQPGFLDPTLKIHQNPPSVFNGFKMSTDLRGTLTKNTFERHQNTSSESYKQKPMNNVQRLNQHEKEGGKMVAIKSKKQKKVQDFRQLIPEISQENINFVLTTATPLWNPFNPFMYNPELFRFVLPIVPIQPPICSSRAYNQISYIGKVFNLLKPNLTTQGEPFDRNSSLHNYIVQLVFGSRYPYLPPGFVEPFYIFFNE